MITNKNNPANLRGFGIKWFGKNGFEKGFSTFSKLEYGITALHTDLTAKIKKGVNTIEKIIEMFAPRSENNTSAYIAFVVKQTKIPKDKLLSYSDLYPIGVAIMKMESGYAITAERFRQIVDAVNLEKKK